ncbi:MAG: lamin tail domain-containing protein [Balneolales bacterium]
MKPLNSHDVSPCYIRRFSFYWSLFLCFYLLPLPAISQHTLFFDDFDDEGVTLNPAWRGDLDDFIIVTENDNHLLRLDGSDSGGIEQLSTESDAAFGTWEFFIRLENFAPSNNNRAFIFLIADRPDLTGDVNGYALRTGENGQPKHFRIIRFTNGSQETVLSAATELEAGDYRVKVTRDEDGAWNLYTSNGFDSTPVIDSEPVVDNTYTESAHFGLRLHYTATRRDRFFFDDIVIRDFTDTIKVTDVQARNSRELDIIFTDRLDESSITPAHFVINSYKAPDSAVLISDNMVRLRFGNSLADGIYDLNISQISDDRGHTIDQNTSFEFEVFNPFNIQKVVAHAADAIDVFFTGPVDGPSLDEGKFLAGNQQHPGSFDILDDDNKVVRLHFDQPFASGHYPLKIYGIQAQSGWDLPENSTSSFFVFDEIASGDVIINEFMYRPVAGGIQRFLEIYNGSDKNVDLNQWQIGRGTGSPSTLQGPVSPDGLASSIPLSSGEYVIVTGDPGFFPEVDNIIETSGFPAFSRYGDAVYIRDDEGNRIDSLFYQPAWGGNADGHSLQRINPNGASNDPTNWAGNSDISAGFQNTSFRADTTPPNMIFATLTDDNRLLVRFNKFITDHPKSVFQLEGKNLSLIDFDPFDSSTLLFGFDHEINQQKNLSFSAQGLVDFSGNVNETSSIPLAQPMQNGDVIISEIMYRPRSDRYSELPDQSEYIELYNRRDHAVSLEGFFLHDQPDRENEVSKREPVNTLAGWIPAREYAVVHSDTEPEFNNTRISASFKVQSNERFFRVDQKTLVLSASNDEVYLANKDEMVIDSVFYQDSWHNPNLVDTRGISLERINPEGPSNDERNWTSSTSSKGGSPGNQNTVYSTPEKEHPIEGLVLGPNPFSPDGNGYEDHLFINYNLDGPDYLMRIRIFDRNGRLVRTLADGEVAGRNGHVIWDGYRDDQTKNRIGIYIILFEAYNSATGSNKTFRETVVLARQL